MRYKDIVLAGFVAAATAGFAGAEQPVQPNDISLGWNNGTASNTHSQLRVVAGTPTFVDEWTRVPFIQTPLFDNTAGIRHNYQGNLVAVNFGGSSVGGGTSFHNVTTNGTNGPASGTGEFYRAGTGTVPTGSVSGTTFGLVSSRSAYPAISPNNDMIAYLGYDTGRLYVVAYNPGSPAGTAAPASVTGGSQTAALSVTLISQGCEWLDANTIVAYVVNPMFGTYELVTVSATRTGSSITLGTPTFQNFVPVPGVGTGSRTLAIIYNPQVCPFLFTLTSSFTNNVSVTQLSAWDPNRLGDGPIRSAIEMGGSSQTSRNGAIGSDRFLYWAQFAGSTSADAVERLNLDQDNDGDIDTNDLTLIADNSSQTIFTKAQTGLTGNSSFPGLDVAVGPPSNMLACCTGTSCAVVMVGTCTGTPLAAGSSCAPVNPCILPQGSCCQGLTCTQTTQPSCATSNGIWSFNLACSPLPCRSEIPVVGGDVAFGLSTADGNTTTQQVRGNSPALVGQWSRTPFIQGFQFDNAGGTLHNAQGNLLALDFGGATTGARVYNLSTNGTNNAQFLYGLNNVPAQNPFAIFSTQSTRATSISVSPSNDKVALYATDATRIVVFAYDAGSSIGTGSGAAFVGAAEQTTVPFSTATSGTAWIDSNTLAVFGFNTSSMVTEIYTYNVTRSGTTITIDPPVFRLATTDTGVPNASRFMSLAFNPTVSPFIYALSSGFDNTTSASITRLGVIDPAAWTQSQSIALTASLNTGRAIAVGPDRQLYIGQFNSSSTGAYIDRLNLDVNGDSSVSSADALTDNSSVNWWVRSTGLPSSSFNGLDVAFEPVVVPVTGACCNGSSCSIQTQTFCASVGGTYQGNATSCNPNPCIVITGVCCRGATCNSSVAQAACTTTGTQWGASFSTSSASCGNSPTSPCCLADFDKVDGITVNDIFAFLNDWFAGSGFADFGGDGSVSPDVNDIFAFLNAWFAGGC